MRRLTTTLSKSFDILHSTLVYLFAACAVHVLFVTSSLKDTYPIVTLLFIALKIFIESGIYGAFIEIASSQEMYPTIESFQRNAKKYWKIYAILTLLKLLIVQGINAVYQYFSFQYSFPPVYLDIFILYLLAFTIIKDKYSQNIVISQKNISLSRKESYQLIFLFTLNILVPRIFDIIHFQNNFLTNEPIAIFMYSHLLLYSFIVHIILNNYPKIEHSFESKKELYLISPAICGLFTGVIYSWLRLHPPFFIVLKALTPSDYTIKKFPMIPWKNRFYKANKLVAITCYTSNCHEAYKIAKEFRKQGSTVILGGPHVTYLPNETLQFCDAVVIGEAESVWEKVLQDYESHQLQPKYYGEALDYTPQAVHEELLKSDPKILKDYIETTRGCKFHCDFCTISSLSEGKLRKKPIKEVLEILKRISQSNYKFILLMDNNIYSDPAYAKDLFKAIKSLRIKWGSQCSIDIGKDPEALRLAKESGCIHLLIGYEIFDKSRESQHGGKLAYSSKYKELTRAIKKAGIPIKAHFIFGFERDKLSDLFHLWIFCVMLRLPFASFTFLTPLPGSPLFARMLKQDRILNYNWRNYDLAHMVFEHKTLNFHFTSIIFFLFRYTAYFTTNTYGYIILAVIFADAIFFKLEHFLF